MASITIKRAGSIFADADIMITAIALAEGASLVTGNRSNYKRIEDLRIEDWIRGRDD